MKSMADSSRHPCTALFSVFLVTAILVAGTAGCVSADYNFTESSIGGSGVTSPRKETGTYVEVTLPDPNFGAALRGATNNETGSVFPSDLQRHNFFSGTT